MRIIVQKFGGTSVADAERLRSVARRVVSTREAGFSPVVVVSAQGDTTDHLIEKAREITARPSAREMDVLLSTGEQISISLLAMAIQALGVPAVSLTGGQVGIRTDDTHTKAKILEIDGSRVLAEAERGNVVIVAGFQGVTSGDDITTLGRGGSDTTAVALAAALRAEVCEIYTDVDGVYSADPRVVPTARKLDEVSYDEMLELASLGARVLHLRCVEIAKKYDTPIHVRSSFNDHPGTIVKEAPAVEKGRVVTGIAHNDDVVKVTIKGVPDRPGVAARLFGALAEREVNVDMIIQSASRRGINDISFTVGRGDLHPAVEVAEAVRADLGAEAVEHDEGVAKVSIVGAGMISHPGVAAAMFRTIAALGVNIHMIATSDISISCVIDGAEVARVVRALHRAFVEEEAPVGAAGNGKAGR